MLAIHKPRNISKNGLSNVKSIQKPSVIRRKKKTLKTRSKDYLVSNQINKLNSKRRVILSKAQAMKSGIFATVTFQIIQATIYLKTKTLKRQIQTKCCICAFSKQSGKSQLTQKDKHYCCSRFGIVTRSRPKSRSPTLSQRLSNN